MSKVYKISLYSFIVLTILSAVILSYTLYLAFGVSWATHKFEVSFLEVAISEDNATLFSLDIYNPSYISLGITLLKVKAYHDGKIAGETIIPFGDFSLPPKTNKTVVIKVKPQSQSFNIRGNWIIDLTFYVKVPLLETTRIQCFASKQVDA